MRYSSVVQATNPIIKATKKFLICRKPAINVMIIKIEMICRCSLFSLKEKGIFCFVNSKFRINNRIKKRILPRTKNIKSLVLPMKLKKIPKNNSKQISTSINKKRFFISFLLFISLFSKFSLISGLYI